MTESYSEKLEAQEKFEKHKENKKQAEQIKNILLSFRDAVIKVLYTIINEMNEDSENNKIDINTTHLKLGDLGLHNGRIITIIKDETTKILTALPQDKRMDMGSFSIDGEKLANLTPSEFYNYVNTVIEELIK